MSFRGTETPNIGEANTITLGGKDDALAAYYVQLTDILTGVIPMAFDHPRHLYDFLVKHFNTPNQPQMQMIAQAEIVSKLAQIRNHRVMAKINALMAEKQGVTLFPLDKPGYELYDIDAVCAEATTHGVSPDKYLDEGNDPENIEGCTNPWNLDQNTESGKAADNIHLLVDLDGKFWVLVIDRAFAPGKGSVAFPGGFLNIGETFAAAASREDDEEVEKTIHMIGGVFMIVLPRIVFEAKLRTLWDTRLKLPHGVIVGGTVEIVICVKNMEMLATGFGMYAKDFDGLTPEGVCEFLTIDPTSESGKSIMAAYCAFKA